MIKSLLPLAISLMKKQKFDVLAVGGIDFAKGRFDSWEIFDGDKISDEPFLFFDLASLTKPLTLSSVWLIYPDLFIEERDFLLLLNHRAGLPEGGRCSKKDWKKQINSYLLRPSPTLYSDFSALRLMLEIEKKTGKKLEQLCSVFWHEKLLYWRNLSEKHSCVVTGMRRGKKIQGQVHDDNAFIIGEFCSHAGLFATVGGLCHSLLDLDKNYNLLNKMAEEFKKHDGERFIAGWDRVMNPQKSLAGRGASPLTFGHLGFTGTSLWIDIEKKMGITILSNAVSNAWFDREAFNELRTKIGAAFWSLYKKSNRETS